MNDRIKQDKNCICCTSLGFCRGQDVEGQMSKVEVLLSRIKVQNSRVEGKKSKDEGKKSKVTEKVGGFSKSHGYI